MTCSGQQRSSSEKMQQFWQAVSLAKIGGKRDGSEREKKKPINCLFRAKANSVNHILELNLVLQQELLSFFNLEVVVVQHVYLHLEATTFLATVF